ncbi:MAG: hypothetical protein KHX03_01590 [Clostridium sp.]|nr:hypothetical protein [Clostridium sp.]
MKKFFVFLSLFAFVWFEQVFAMEIFKHPETAASIASKMPEFNNAECKFEQNKYMKTSNVNLDSGGNFKFIKEQGVIFETTRPIHSTSQYTTSQNKNINAVIKAIAAKNYTYLDKNFNLYYQKHNQNGWLLALAPKQNGQLRGEIGYILVYGSSSNLNGKISKMIIDTKNTKTTINFIECR